MRRKEFSILILLAALCAIVAFMNPQFLSSENIQNTSRLIGTYGIFSIGVGVVIITGGIDLSVGSVYALSGVSAAIVLRAMGPLSASATVTIGLSVCLGVGLLCGLLNGALVVGSDLATFYRAPGTTTWQVLGSGLPTTTVMDIESGPDGNIYAATHGRGIWSIRPPA